MTDNSMAFKPRLLSECDGRGVVVKELRKRTKKLEKDMNCDTIQKKMIAGHAAFIELYLESMEAKYADGIKIDERLYAQMSKTFYNMLALLMRSKK